MELRYHILSVVFLFVAGSASCQSMWDALFPKEKSNLFDKAYRSINNNHANEISFASMKSYVKALNEFSLMHFSGLNDEFQKKVVSHLVSTDSMAIYNDPEYYHWWQQKFIQLAEIMPVFAIQQQVGEIKQPVDTLEILVPGTDKVISVIVNNEVIKGYLLSAGKESLVTERNLRYLYSEDVYDLIAFYRTGEIPKREQQLLAEEEDSLNASDRKELAFQTDHSEEMTSSNDNKITEEYDEKSGLPPADLSKGIAYRIQIAASREPLTKEELNDRYEGNRTSKQFREEGWVKYYVAEVPRLTEALSILEETAMPKDAFIMSYKNGQKAPEYLNAAFANESSTFKNLAPHTYNGKVWVVQIAAAQNSLSMEDVENRYPGNKPVYYITEGPWHRYSIGLFDSFSAANMLRKDCDVPDAFVATYSDGHRLDSWTKSGSSKITSIQDKPIRYIVQVAASYRKLPYEELHRRYPGDSTIIHFKENGYHKYAIGKYETYGKARRAQEECGVPDAFIKAYQGDQKINLFRAKKITDKN